MVDEIFLDQVFSGGLSTLESLRADPTPLGQARSKYFWINKGPWSALDQQSAFVPGVPARKPPGANFYPEDLTKEEFEAFVQALPAAEQQKARGFFSVVRRGPKRELRIIPYSAAYGPALVRAAKARSACCTILSSVAEIPMGRVLPGALGMCTRRTGPGRYVCSRTACAVSSRNRSTP